MRVQDAGRVLMVGFDGAVVNDHVREALALGVGGFILFTRNIQEPAQVGELIAEIRALAPDRRLLFAVDQEGGRVTRLGPPCTVWPKMRVLGQTGDEELAFWLGTALAAEMRALGFDLNFAPVVDVDANPDNPVIGDRSFGRDPQLVARMGAALIKGLQSGGVLACAKHFPGHGNTDKDSHHELPVIEIDEAQWRAVDLPPFAAAAAADVAAVMTAHIVLTHADEALPATLSPRVLTLLRKQLRFNGMIVSDDLEMKAVAAHYAPGEAALLAARAGCDLLLVCRQWERQEAAVRALYDAHRSGALPPLRLIEMRKRIEAAAFRFPPPGKGDLSVLGCDEHRRLAAMIKQIGEERE